MSDVGSYGELQPGVIYGTGNEQSESDPIRRAALQEAVTQQMIARAGEPGYVPQSYQGNPQAGPSNQQLGGPGNLPIIGWTAQNATGPAFREPYTADGMGHIPDWTGDPNSIAAGRYDMNEVWTGEPVNPLNRAPIGGAVLEYPGETNPNAPTTDVGGTGTPLEY